MNERAPYNGEPFYCATCGAGFGEFMACEQPDCELEDRAVAKERMLNHASLDRFSPELQN